MNKNLKLKGPHKGIFIIGKNGVTLDCDGHTVTGAGRRVDQPAVLLSGRQRVTVRNCDLRAHGSGFQLDRSHRNTLASSRVGNAHRGFWLERSDRNKLIANHVADVDNWFGYGLFFGSDKNQLRDNVATDVGGVGFIVSESNRNVLADDVAQDGKPGPKGWAGEGFGVHPGSIGNTYTGNSATGNIAWGIADQTTGFKGDAGSDNRYSDNTCIGTALATRRHRLSVIERCRPSATAVGPRCAP